MIFVGMQVQKICESCQGIIESCEYFSEIGGAKGVSCAAFLGKNFRRAIERAWAAGI